MRVVKEAEERKNEILDVAERLFISRGFDRTSTNDILEEVGIARGTLYYHFKSKEEILDALITREMKRLIAKASTIASDREIPAPQRIAMTIMGIKIENDIAHEFLDEIHKPQNALMHQKMQSVYLAEINPIITKLVEECVDQGIFDTQYPEETVEMVMLYSNTVFYILSDTDAQVKKRRIDAFIYNLERLFGMTPGSMRETVLPIFGTNS